TPRMQYTGASFVQPVMHFFEPALGPTRSGALPSGLFPARSRVETRILDPARERGFAPLFAAVDWLARRLRWLPGGSGARFVLSLGLPATPPPPYPPPSPSSSGSSGSRCSSRSA